MDSAMALLDLNDRKRRLSENSECNELDDDEGEDCLDTLDQSRQLRRSSRKKVKDCDKRRVISQPRKLGENSDIKQIHNYYLDKRIKKSSPCLETIFEEPQCIKGKLVSVSHKKLKRVLNFSMTPSGNKLKVKKRQMKSKKAGISKKHGKRVSMQVLLDKLSNIEDED